MPSSLHSTTIRILLFLSFTNKIVYDRFKFKDFSLLFIVMVLMNMSVLEYKKEKFAAKLALKNDEKISIANKEEATSILNEIKKGSFIKKCACKEK